MSDTPTKISKASGLYPEVRGRAGHVVSIALSIAVAVALGACAAEKTRQATQKTDLGLLILTSDALNPRAKNPGAAPASTDPSVLQFANALRARAQADGHRAAYVNLSGSSNLQGDLIKLLMQGGPERFGYVAEVTQASGQDAKPGINVTLYSVAYAGPKIFLTQSNLGRNCFSIGKSDSRGADGDLAANFYTCLKRTSPTFSGIS